MNNRAFWIAAVLTGVIAFIGALPLFDLGGSERLVILDAPGMILSMIITHNVHAFSAVFSFLLSWTFWFAVFVFLRKIITRSHGL